MGRDGHDDMAAAASSITLTTVLNSAPRNLSYPPGTVERNRAAAYRSVLKVGNSAASAASVAAWLAALSFLSTPFGLWCLFLSLHLCSGFVDTSTVREYPWSVFVGSSVITATLSVSSFCVFARYWDGLYCHNREQRNQPAPSKEHSVHGPLFNRSEVRLSCLNLCIAAVLSAALVVSTVAAPPQWQSKLYLEPSPLSSAYDFSYLLFSTMAYFLFIDLWAYIAHRIMHYPIIYRTIHKWHHAYTQPTAFAALGLHPCDMVLLQACIYAFLFALPMHPAAVAINLLYVHYHNVVDHSGVYAESWLPWQPSSLYHDDHHRLFHMNYGQSLTLWDRLGGTFYSPKKSYGENQFSF